MGVATDSRVDDVLCPRIVVNVDRHASEGRHLCGQLIQAGVVLAFALVGFGHCGGEDRFEGRKKKKEEKRRKRECGWNVTVWLLDFER